MPLYTITKRAKCLILFSYLISYEARRVILKQGHRPEAFYIIISGQVIANIEEKSPTTGRNYIRTVHELGPGDTFGVRYFCISYSEFIFLFDIAGV